MGRNVYNDEVSGTQAVEAADAPNQTAIERSDHDVATSKSTRSPAFQFYPKDFLSSSKVELMSMTERGIYITLLSRCWLDNGLPTDFKALAKFAGMKLAQFSRMWTSGTLHQCFFERGGRLYNDRLERERKAQLEYRRKQKERADQRWHPKAVGNAAALPESQASGNAPHLQPAICDPHTPPKSVRNAPLHDASHRKHAHCGRVCLPAALFSEFVRRRNHDDADREIRDWCMVVEREWGVDGPQARVEPGEPYSFWKARYDEKWPATVTAKASNQPAWMRKAGA